VQGEGSIQNSWNHQSSNVEEGSVENVGLIESDSLKWQGCTAPILHLPPSSFCCHSSVSLMEPLMHKMVCKLSSSLCVSTHCRLSGADEVSRVGSSHGSLSLHYYLQWRRWWSDTLWVKTLVRLWLHSWSPVTFKLLLWRLIVPATTS